MPLARIVDCQLIHWLQVHKLPRQTELILVTNMQTTMQQKLSYFCCCRHIADFLHINDWHTANAEDLDVCLIFGFSNIIVVIVRTIREAHLHVIKRLALRLTSHQERVISYVQNIVFCNRNGRRRRWHVVTIRTTCRKIRIRNDI